MKKKSPLLQEHKCVIFDMDGVLIDSEPLHFEFESNFFKSLGITVTRKQHETFVGTTAKTMWTIIKQTFNLPFSVQELILNGQSEFLNFLKNSAPIMLIPGIEDLLIKLKDAEFHLALASSSPYKFINYVLDTNNINKFFSIKVSGDDVADGKPNPEIFLKTAELIGIKPENCLVIEDSTNGVKAAITAGMKCLGYSNPGSGNQDLSEANLIIKSFQKLSISTIENLFI